MESPPNDLVLGIDLGTTYSTAAAVLDGRIHFALDGRGEPCLPSVVHFPKSGPPVVGAEADRLRGSDPQNTVHGVKRILGRTVDSPAARLLDAASAFRIKGEGEAEARVQVRTGEYAASEVAALILRHLKERAETRFGKRVRRVVLTVPVLAGPEVREAMQRCGRAAGLEVTRIVHEPCAGALSKGLGTAGSTTAPVLVYDFGGGTLDTTVVKREGENLRVLASGGDDCLGGDDFDAAFARWVASGIYRNHGVDVTRDAVLWDRIQRQCELVKRALSSAQEARYQVKDGFVVGGRPMSIDVAVRRDHLTAPWAELVQRSVEAARATVAEAGLQLTDLAAVLLIGGTTYIPQVRAAVQRAFPCPMVVEEDPQTAVARGAAMVARRPELLQD